MTFDDWFRSKQGEPYDSMYVFARDAWHAATADEREACARAAEGFTEERDDRQWVPGSLYDTLRRETAAAIRKRSNLNSATPVA